jgi:hypothetical protein
MGNKPWAAVLCLSGKNLLLRGETSLEGDEHTSRPRTVRTELRIQEVARLVHASCCRNNVLLHIFRDITTA